jgi:hypothetical protein
MKKVTTLFSTVLIALLGVISVQAQDLFFSEYIEGSGNNKAFEIYNPTADTVDLSNYLVLGNYNGNPFNDTLRFSAGTTLPPFNTFVVAHDGADSAITAVADSLIKDPYGDGTSYIAVFNGDDARGLFKISGTDTTLIDLFGTPDNDPGSGWDVAGVLAATKDHTLIRKSNIGTGNATPLGSFGTDEASSEWIVKDKNDFSNLGTHTFGYEVTFQADMRDILDSAAFVPGTDYLTIPGSFNGWDTAADTLKDADEDSIYTKTLTLVPGDYSFKFHLYASRINGGYENLANNREITVSKDSVLEAKVPQFEYSDLSNAIFGDIELNFRVNMAVQTLNGNFDPNKDHVVVAGDMNGWNTTADTLTLSRVDDVYEGVVKLNQAIPAKFSYKYVIKPFDESGDVYESIDNRALEVKAEDYDSKADAYIVNDKKGAAYYFSDISFDDVFQSETNVVFKVDMRPAFYLLADSLALPADVQTGSDADSTFKFVIGNGPLFTDNGSWETWGPSLGDAAKYVFNDEGKNGDEVAGDSVFTQTFTYSAGDPKKGQFKFGVNGADNENISGNNHSVVIGSDNQVSVIFGAIPLSDGTVNDDLYDPYIKVTTEGPVVVRRGGTNDDDVVVPNEKEPISSPQEFSLSQNYPNPFNPSTNINFTLATASKVKLTVYNILGQQVAQLVNGKLTAGLHTVRFDASKLASGMYLYRIEAGTFTKNMKMMLIK